MTRARDPAPRYRDRSRWRQALSLAAAGLLGACASLPPMGPAPELGAPTDYAATDSLAAATSAQWPSERWWTAYKDPQLSALIDEALAQAPDLAAAEARLHRAQGLAQIAGAALGPQIDAKAAVIAVQPGDNSGLTPAPLEEGWNDIGLAGISAAYQLDLFGKNRAQLAAASSNAEAARVEVAAARLALTTAVAAAYADLDRLYSARDATQAAVRIRKNSQDLLEQRAAHGLESQGMVEQARAARANAELRLAANEAAIELGGNRIAALTGAGPDRARSLTRPALDPRAGWGLPQRLQADLVGRRADLVAARRRAEAASSQVGAAKAGFYPNINLVALGGYQSLGLDQLFESASAFGLVAPSVSLPIFHSGQLRGAYRGARAEHEAAVANYHQSLLRALNEVADAVASKRSLQTQQARAREALSATEHRQALAEQRYRHGFGSYLEVLAAEEALVSSRQSAAELKSRAFALDVALTAALGGGFDSTAPSTD